MIMRKLTRSMWKELESAQKYAECSEVNKSLYPEISDMYKTLAYDELKHSRKFYDHVMKLAEKDKDKMLDIPNWLIESWMQEQKDYMEKYSKVAYMIEMIK